MRQVRLLDADQWGEIIDSLGKNRARTLLTAFGVFWGIFMLVLLMGGGKGLESMLAGNFAGFASNSGFVATSRTSLPYKGFREGRDWHIRLGDAESVRRSMPEVDVCAPTLQQWGVTAKAGTRDSRVVLRGVTEEYALVDDPKIKFGRPLSAVDDRQRRKVCVIGTRVVEELFPGVAGGNPVGQYLLADGVYYRVVGVSGRSSGGMSIGGNPTSMVELPYSTLRQAYNRGDRVDILCLTARPHHKMSDIEARVETLLKRAHRVHPDDAQAVFKLNTEAIFSMMDTLFSGVGILVWMIGLGTLLAGSIGVSNIMIVAVRERTTEIGIRRAIGATPVSILSMVMSESVVITMLSGMSGITLAVLVLQVMEAALGDGGQAAHFQISFSLAVGAASLLALLGVLAGLAPALRAMRIKPVDAMREE